MRIGIDVRCLAEGKTTGVEEYTQRVLRHLFDEHSEHDYVLFYNSFKGSRAHLEWVYAYPNVTIRDYRFPNKLLNFSLWFFRWPKLDRLIGGVDVFFATNITFSAVSEDCFFVLTIHDLSFERFAHFFSWKRRLWHFLVNPRWLCHRADLILAVSESTKHDLTELYRIPKKNITVLWPPLSFSAYHPQTPSKEQLEHLSRHYGIQTPYILFLGTIEPRKNVIAVIQAFELLKHFALHDPHFSTILLQGNMVVDYRSLRLVLAGSWGWNTHAVRQKYQRSAFRSEIVFTDTIVDHDKPLVYQAATVFVYPSYFEGFGFPPLEAMASGLPVITSNCSSIPEVVEDAAVLIDPYRPDDIYQALRVLLDDQAVYDTYVGRGKKRIAAVAARPLQYGQIFQQLFTKQKSQDGTPAQQSHNN